MGEDVVFGSSGRRVGRWRCYTKECESGMLRHGKAAQVEKLVGSTDKGRKGERRYREPLEALEAALKILG